MKIVNITTSRESIPLKTPFVTALRSVDAVEFIRVKIEFDDGSLREGEAPATKAVTGEDLDSIEQNIKEITPTLYTLTQTEALETIHQSKMGSSAKAALDIALFDQQELKDISSIQTDITISLGSVEKMLYDAHKAYAQGIEILKVKLGSEIQHAVAITRLLAKELPNAQLLIDANQAWSVEQSLYYLKEVHELHSIKLIEQPVQAKDLEGLRQITQNSPFAILADEAVYTLEDVKYVHQNSIADMINIKLMKCGGVSRAIEILEYARQNQIHCMLGSMLEGPLSINAALRLAFNYRDVIRYVDLDSPLLYKEPSDLLEFSFNGSEVCAL